MQGTGRLSFPDTSRYEGGFRDNTYEGPGKFFYTDGKVLSGQFKEGYIEGKVLITYPDGSTEEAEYVKGERVDKPAGVPAGDKNAPGAKAPVVNAPVKK
jgi:hypothetical protein